MGNELLGSVAEEFEGADLAGDERLNQRLALMARALGGEPEKSIAGSARSRAAREAAYRFLENRRVDMAAILEPHQEATAARCRGHETLVVSDTTEFTFSGETRGTALGRLQGKRRGFLGHFAIAVSAEGDRKPLGVLGIEPIVRSDERPAAHRNARQQAADPNRESLRWHRMVETAEGLLDGSPAIHVMDAEADAYELLSAMVQKSRRFIVRVARDRLVTEGKLLESVASAPTMVEREVELSARPRPRGTTKGRGLPARRSRSATLALSTKQVSLLRPRLCSTELPEVIDLHAVHVVELNPPEDEAPVEWLLFTTEPTQSVAEIEKVVDGYRARWTIEEYFKALKSGCAYEGRQLRSMRTLTNALAIFAVIAYRLLLLRHLERTAPETPAVDVLDPVVIEALAARLKDVGERKPLPASPSVARVMQAIAQLGGHNTSNGAPGWQVLWRGFQDLLTWAAGFIAGRSSGYRDHS